MEITLFRDPLEMAEMDPSEMGEMDPPVKSTSTTTYTTHI